MSSLISTKECKLLLCHSQHQKRWFGKCGKKVPSKLFDLPMNYFMEAGFSIDQISFEIMEYEKNPTHCILNKARYGNYGTIVIGRRGLTPLKKMTLSRVGNSIFRNADNHVVWIVQ